MKNLTQYRSLLKFPTDEDLTGAATALIRLQDTYKLDTASVARGELNGIQYSTQLSGKYNLLFEILSSYSPSSHTSGGGRTATLILPFTYPLSIDVSPLTPQVLRISPYNVYPNSTETPVGFIISVQRRTPIVGVLVDSLRNTRNPIQQRRAPRILFTRYIRTPSG